MAQAARLALTAELTGHEAFLIAAADTCMTRPSTDLLAEVYPDVPLRRSVEGFETLLSIEKARTLLGYEPGTIRGGTRSRFPDGPIVPAGATGIKPPVASAA